MRVLFTTNFPSPYRVSFFNVLAGYVDLTVAYERRKALHRDSGWKSDEERKFREVFLDLKPRGTSQSTGKGMAKYIAANSFD